MVEIVPLQHDDDLRAKGVGATAYIAKPYRPRDLLVLIRKTVPES